MVHCYVLYRMIRHGQYRTQLLHALKISCDFYEHNKMVYKQKKTFPLLNNSISIIALQCNDISLLPINANHFTMHIIIRYGWIRSGRMM